MDCKRKETVCEMKKTYQRYMCGLNMKTTNDGLTRIKNIGHQFRRIN